MGLPGDPPDLEAAGLRIAVLVARYNQEISRRLLAGAMEALAGHGVAAPAIGVHWVPGAFELPLAALTLAASGEWDAIVCLGCVIRGETPHFDFVAGQAAAGVERVALDTGVPCAFGVLTTVDLAQAEARSAPGSNRGVDAAETAIEMANLLRTLRGLVRE